MRQLSAAVAAALATDHPTLFWSAVLHFGGTRGDVYVVGAHPVDQEPLVIDGKTHEQVVLDWGEIGSALDAGERRMDVPTFQVTFTNMLALGSGERWSDLWLDGSDQVDADFFFNVVDDDGVIHSFRWLTGAVDASQEYSIPVATHRVLPLSEKYLEADAVAVLNEKDFPGIRKADIGKTLYLPIGSVPRAPARVVRTGDFATDPVADPANAGGAELRDVVVAPTALTQDWVVQLSPDEIHRQLTSNGSSEVGKLTTGVTVGNITADAPTGATASRSFAHVQDAGTGRLLVVTVGNAIESPPAFVTGVTYAGQPLTLKGSAGRSTVWYLANPPTGSNTVQVTLDNAANLAIVAYSFTNATSLGAANVVVRSALSPNTITIDTAALDKVVDRVSKSNTGSGVTAGGGQTVEQNLTRGGADGDGVITGSSRKNASAPTTTMTWTATSGPSLGLVAVQVPARPDIYGQQFQTVAGQTVVAVKLELERNPAYDATLAAAYSVHIEGDASGQPNGVALRSASGTLTGTGPQWVLVTVPDLAVTGGTPYWVTVRGMTDAQGRGAVLWRKASGGGYGSGKASQGTCGETAFKRAPAHGGAGNAWSGGMDAQDFAFELVFQAGNYTVTGSTMGADGQGNVNADFTSLSGQITLERTAWVGSPAAGDRFTFQTDTSPAELLFGVSPVETPVSGIPRLYWDGVRFGGATLAQTTDAEGRAFGKSTDQFGVSLAQSIRVPGGPGILSDTVEVKLAKVGAPTEPVVVEVRQDSGGLPLGNVVATGTITASQVGTTAAFVGAKLSRPVVWSARTWLVLTTRQASDANHYVARRSGTDVYTEGEHLNWDKNNQKWVTTGKDLAFRVVAAATTTELSVLDVTGRPVARVKIAAEIPDDAAVTGDVEGWQDDVAGTYTGVPGALIRLPDAVFHRLLRYAGVSPAHLDLDTFAAARVGYGSTYRLDGLVGADGPTTWKRVVLDLGFEVRSVVDWMDRVRLVFLPDPPVTIARTVPYAVMAPVGVAGATLPEMTLGRDKSMRLVNDITLEWGRVWATDQYERTAPASDAASIDRYKSRQAPELFRTDYVRTEAHAQALAGFWLRWFKAPPRRFTARLQLTEFALEKHDIIGPDLTNPELGGQFPLTLPATLGDTFDLLDGTRPFRIERQTLDPGQAPSANNPGRAPSIVVVAREVT